jgi:hypothetical protein
MSEKIAITTTYEMHQCGDGCCSWSTTKVESDDGVIDFEQDYCMFYSLNDFKEWLNEYMKDGDYWWEEFYYIDEKNSSFY